jgi:hypothetical protein
MSRCCYMDCYCASCELPRNIRLTLVCWWGHYLGSYLIAQFVRYGGAKSSFRALTRGVPQGYVLGLLLFISYITDVSRVIRYCHFHIYADDLPIYHTCAVSDFQRCIDELNLDLQRVHE